VIAAARLAGATTIVAVDREAGKLERARLRGATHWVDARTGDVVAQVLAVTDGGVQHAFEVVGDGATIRQAWDVLRPAGTAVVVGLAPRGVEVSLPAIELLSEKSLTGSYYGSADVAKAIVGAAQLLLDGRLALEDVISDVIALDQVEDAFARLRQGEGARSVIVVDEGLAGRRL
jgi:S-(hydroxymethyl)glutathione dehydrogenase/alcohol dehydrogenase